MKMLGQNQKSEKCKGGFVALVCVFFFFLVFEDM